MTEDKQVKEVLRVLFIIVGLGFLGYCIWFAFENPHFTNTELVTENWKQLMTAGLFLFIASIVRTLPKITIKDQQ